MPSETNFIALANIKKENKKLIRQAKRKEEIRIADLSKENPKSFFSYVNNRKPIRCKIAQLKDSQGVYQTYNKVISNLFNEYFSSVFTKENNLTPEPRIRFEILVFINIKLSIIDNLIQSSKQIKLNKQDGMS